MATVQYIDKTTGIVFSTVDIDSNPKHQLAGKTFPYGWSNAAIDGVSNTDTPLQKGIDAIFIDWNGATLDNTVINTTGDLLKFIKDYADKKLDSVPVATSSVYGGFKLGFPQLDNNYPVQLDSNGKAYVNVPWTDTNTTYKAGTNIGIDPFEPINPIAQSINTSNSDISTVDAGTSHIDSSSIIGNPSVLTIYHATPENASEGQKGNKSDALLATITTDAQGHVTGYETITPEELWRLLQQYADALYQPKPKPIIGVTGISLNKDTLPVRVNGIGEVIATISPSNATNQNITWTSSDDAIATVTSHTTSGSPATVTWKSRGNTTITATAEGDESKQATCIILCQAPQPATTYYSYVGTDLSGKLVDPPSGNLKSDIATQITTMEGVKTYDSVPSSLTAGTTINANQNYVYVIAPTSTLNNASIYLTNTSGGTIGTETLGTFIIDSIEYTVKCTPSEVGTVVTAWKN